MNEPCVETVAVYAVLTWVCSHPPFHPSSVKASTFPRAEPDRKATAAELNLENKHQDKENSGNYTHSGGYAC